MAAVTAAGPAVAFAHGADAKGGHGAVAIRFVDRCDGGTDVQTPNPYDTGSLAFTVNAVVIIVDPGEKPWHSVPPPGSDLELVVKVSVREPAGTDEKTTHRWKRPKSCTSEQDVSADLDGDQYANGDSNGDDTYGADANGDDGYGADANGDDGYGDVGDASDGAVTSPADGDVDVSATSQSAASTGLLGQSGQDDPDTSAGSLALTGTNIWMLGGTGLMLVAVGLILLMLRKRKVRFEAP